MPGAVRASLPLLLLALLQAVARAHANPHVWVEAVVTFEFEEHRVTGLAFAWRFDEYYSSHTNRSFDRDGDGTLGTAETEGAAHRDVRTRSLGSTTTCTSGREVDDAKAMQSIASPRKSMKTDSLSNSPSRLHPPPAPNDGSLIVSLFDPKNVVAFRFAESDFLLVDGEVTPGCKFRIARGKGEQSGHPHPVTLRCGG